MKEKLIKIEIRVAKKLKKNIKNLRFKVNNFYVCQNLNLGENGLYSGCSIEIIEKDWLNKIQEDNQESDDEENFGKKKQNILINNRYFIVSYNCPIRLLTLYYAITNFSYNQIMDFINGKSFHFNYNMEILKFSDNRKVGEIFKYDTITKIIVSHKYYN